MADYDKVTQASLNSLYVKAQELDRGHNESEAPKVHAPGFASDTVTHASDSETRASDAVPRTSDLETHASDAENRMGDAETRASEAESHAGER